MAGPKKGQGIAFKIPGQDAPVEVHPAHPAPDVSTAAGAVPAAPRTGVGMLSRLIAGVQADTEAVSRLEAEVERLKLQAGEQLIDPRQIVATRWADRHPDSFKSAAFVELKREIESAGANVQPIKVRPLRGAGPESADGARFELVYGSRRTRACLELGLPVRAVVDKDIDDQALYVQMQRENRGRANLSAWEQGVSYHKALAEGLFPSARRLAEQIGVDHSNVAKALRVAELPQEIVGAFRSPVEIQFRWAVALDKAHQRAPEAVLSAARKVAGQSPRPAAAEVFRALSAAAGATSEGTADEATRTLALGGSKRGVIRYGKGGAVTVELPRGALAPGRREAFESGLRTLLSELHEAS